MRLASHLVLLTGLAGCTTDAPEDLFGGVGGFGGSSGRNPGDASSVGSGSTGPTTSVTTSSQVSAASTNVATSVSNATSVSAASTSVSTTASTTSAATVTTHATATTASTAATTTASTTATTAASTAATTAASSSSTGVGPEICGNGFDDDVDGAVDCNDVDCNGQPGCAPVGWVCDPSFYGSGGSPFAICDCGCGAPDPDCSIPNAFVFGCQQDESCVGGVCIPPAPFEDCDNGIDDDANGAVDCADAICLLTFPGCMAPGWTCAIEYYDEPSGNQFCDCGCGIPDPDCASALVSACDYCDDPGACSELFGCVSINPTNNAVCN